MEMMASYTALPIPSPSSLIPLIADWRFTVVKQAVRQPYQAAQPTTGALLPELFPEPPQPQAASSGRVVVRAFLSAIALAAGAVVLLLRIAGRSPVTTIWAEDRTVFLVQALAGPGHLFASYAGYLQLLPRIIGQLVAFLPLPDAAAAFAISGAVIATAVALFVFHASAGHIRSGWLRGLLAAAVLLLPVAPLEIADSGVNTPWYLLFAPRPAGFRGRRSRPAGRPTASAIPTARSRRRPATRGWSSSRAPTCGADAVLINYCPSASAPAGNRNGAGWPDRSWSWDCARYWVGRADRGRALADSRGDARP